MLKHNDPDHKLENDKFTVAGTNVDAVKRANERSGLSYNEAKELIAKTTGGHGTSIYSDTNVKEVKKNNQESQNKKSTER